MFRVMTGVALGAALFVGACAENLSLPQLPPAPAAIADTTTVDEKAALTVEIAYKAVGALYEAALDAGVLKGAAAARADAIDAKIKVAVDAARTAYDAGNSAGYAAAIATANPLLDELRRIATGRE